MRLAHYLQIAGSLETVVVAVLIGKWANRAGEGSLGLLSAFSGLRLLPFLDPPARVLASLPHPERMTRQFSEGPTCPWGMSTCARMCANPPSEHGASLAPRRFYLGESLHLHHCVEGKIHTKF